MSLGSYITKKEPVMAAALVSSAIGLALKFGWEPSTMVLAVVGAVSSIALAFLARSKVTPTSKAMKDFIESVNARLGVNTSGTGPVVAPEPTPAADAAIGGAAGGAAGAAVGGAVGGAVGSVIGAVTGGLKQVLSGLRRNKGAKP